MRTRGRSAPGVARWRRRKPNAAIPKRATPSAARIELPAVELLGGERDRREEAALRGRSSAHPTTIAPSVTSRAGARRSTASARSLRSSSEAAAAKSAARSKPDRRRQLEAGVRAEQHARGGERVQAEERRARDERERDQEEPCVASPASSRRDAEPERRRHERRAEDEPEVRGMVLPVPVDRGACEQHDEKEERCNCDGDPGAGTHPVSSIPEAGLSSAAR